MPPGEGRGVAWFPSATLVSGDRILVAWQHNVSAGQLEIMSVLWEPMGSEPLIWHSVSGVESGANNAQPSVAATREGALVSWVQFRPPGWPTVAYATWADNGTWSPTRLLGLESPESTIHHATSVVLPDHGLAVAWEEASSATRGTPQLRLGIRAAEGNWLPQAVPLRDAEARQMDPRGWTDGEHFHLAFQEYDGRQFRLLISSTQNMTFDPSGESRHGDPHGTPSASIALFFAAIGGAKAVVRIIEKHRDGFSSSSRRRVHRG